MAFMPLFEERLDGGIERLRTAWDGAVANQLKSLDDAMAPIRAEDFVDTMGKS